MSEKPSPVARWQPRPCPAPGCGGLLQAEVAWCPFCGAAQEAGTRAAAPALPPPAPPRPVAPKLPAETQSRPPAVDVVDVVAEVDPVALTASVPSAQTPPPLERPAQTSPPPAVPLREGRHRSRWPLLLLVPALVVAWLWLRPAPEPEPEWLAYCRATSAQAQHALSAGDPDGAEAALAEARLACQDEALDALGPLVRQIADVRAVANECSALESRAGRLIEQRLPAQALARLEDKRTACAGRTAFDTLVERAARRIDEAAALLADGTRRLEEGDPPAAERLLAQALQVDPDVTGADRLRRALAQAAREVAVPVADPPVPLPQAASTPASDSASASTDALAAELVRDGQNALTNRNYAEARTLARSALRLSPRHAAANDLLKKAEAAEQKALQDIIIN